VTFTIGGMASGASVTATVTAQATEDGSGSDNASVTATTQDPNPSNNSASVTTSFAEPAINVSPPITTSSQTLTNFQAATFTHANAVEPTGNFSATINWGDGRTSKGTIALSGTTYTVTGSHSYRKRGNHTITTTVVETGNGVVKMDVSPASVPPGDRDVVQLSGGSDDGDGQGSGSGDGSSSGGGDDAVVSSPAGGNRSVWAGRTGAATPPAGGVDATGIAILDLYAIPQGASDGASSAAGLEPLSWVTPGTAGRRRLGSRPQ
jgi:hypothetical protein